MCIALKKIKCDKLNPYTNYSSKNFVCNYIRSRRLKRKGLIGSFIVLKYYKYYKLKNIQCDSIRYRYIYYMCTLFIGL
jgi:hypothetical protein